MPKMINKFLIMCLIGMGFLSSSYAAETCISNASELAAQKAAFPKFLQEDPPVLFTRDSMPVAAVNFRIVDNRIMGEAIYKVLVSTERDNGYIKRICYDGSNLKVILEVQSGGRKENKHLDVKIINDSTISVKGFELKKSSPAKFAAVLNKLNGGRGRTGSNAGAQSGTR